jgi:hypothetical protein
MIFSKEVFKHFKFILPALIFATLFSYNVNAQDEPLVPQLEQEQATKDFNDQELQQFASAAEKVMVIQQETEQKMIEAIEGENLEIDKFNEILRSQQDQEVESTATEDEMNSFNNAAEKIIQIQTAVQTDMMRVIQEEGLEPQKYEQILMAYQSDPQTKAKVDAILHNDVAE